MTKRRKTCRVSYEQAVRYHSGQPAKYTDSPLFAWSVWSLPPLILNDGGLLPWVFVGFLVTPLVIRIFGRHSFVSGAAMMMTGCAFVNMFLIMMIPEWLLTTVYAVIAGMVIVKAET